MKAVILAGGRGRRLEPVTLTIPKVLVPLGEVPMLEIVLHQLRAAGFTQAILALGHMGELVEAFVSDVRGRLEGLEISTVSEQEPTGTAGPLTLVPDLDETFLVMNGDVLTDLDLAALVADHRAVGAPMTVACTRKALRLRSGVLHFDPESGRLARYEEKPTISYTASMGVYVYEPSALREVPRGRSVSQPEVVERLLARGMTVHCHLAECLWYDIGTSEGYRKAEARFTGAPEMFLPAQHAFSHGS